MDGRHLVILLVAFGGIDGQRLGDADVASREQIAKNGAHLLEAQRDLFSFFVASIRNDDKVCRAILHPAVFIVCGRES